MRGDTTMKKLLYVILMLCVPFLMAYGIETQAPYVDPVNPSFPGTVKVGSITMTNGDPIGGSAQFTASRATQLIDMSTWVARPVEIVVGRTPDCDYVCDGINDQVEINAALAAAWVTDTSTGAYSHYGGVVKLRNGAYNITSGITMQYGTTLMGEGQRGTQLVVSGGVTAITMNHKCTVKELAINMEYGTGAIGITMTGTYNFAHDLTFSISNSGGTGNTGIVCAYANHQIYNCNFYLNNAAAKAISIAGSNSPDDIHIYANNIAHYAGVGINISGDTERTFIYNNKFMSGSGATGSIGINIADTNVVGTIIDGNSFTPYSGVGSRWLIDAGASTALLPTNVLSDDAGVIVSISSGAAAAAPGGTTLYEDMTIEAGGFVPFGTTNNGQVALYEKPETFMTAVSTFGKFYVTLPNSAPPNFAMATKTVPKSWVLGSGTTAYVLATSSGVIDEKTFTLKVAISSGTGIYETYDLSPALAVAKAYEETLFSVWIPSSSVLVGGRSCSVLLGRIGVDAAAGTDILIPSIKFTKQE